MKNLFIITIILLLVNCSNTVLDSQNDKSKDVKKEQTSKEQPGTTTYPVIPNEILFKLANETSAIDIIFDELPISMSITEQSSIRGNISYLSILPAKIGPEDKPIGTVIFQTEGEITAEFDFYFSQNTKCWVLKKDNKVIGGNMLNSKGINFFNQAFDSIKNR